ncbi:MAG: SpoIIE family protein phosphatase [Chloroflexi bacterium]|nr:SpoIIE family protein phosphatase [Chloroflexota bacterium]
METLNPQRPLEWTALSRTYPGQSLCGDQYLVAARPDGMLAAVVDGLGHGDGANQASLLAIATLQANLDKDVLQLTRLCHTALSGTRGVVMDLAAIDAHAGKLSWIGVGNVEAVLVRSGKIYPRPYERVIQRSGVVGYQIPVLKESSLPIDIGDLLIMTTDGIHANFTEMLSGQAGNSTHQIAHNILDRYGKENDDALVLVARYTGTNL